LVFDGVCDLCEGGVIPPSSVHLPHTTHKGDHLLISTNFRRPVGLTAPATNPQFSGKPSVDRIARFVSGHSDFFKASELPTRANTATMDADKPSSRPGLFSMLSKVRKQIKDVEEKKVGTTYIGASFKDRETANKQLSDFEKMYLNQGYKVETNVNQGTLKARKTDPGNWLFNLPRKEDNIDYKHDNASQGDLLGVLRISQIEYPVPKLGA
jgi:hypothetical protein